MFKINEFLDCGAANVAHAPFTFECDNPMDMQWGADGSFYLLTYGDGFFNINADAGMYRWEYVKGQRAPKAVLTTDRTDGPLPLTVNFSSAGSQRRRSGRLDPLRVGLRRRLAHSIDAEPDAHLHHGRAATRPSSRSPTRPARRRRRARSSRPATPARRCVVNAPVDGGTFAFGDDIQFKVTVTDPEDGAINCTDVAGDVRARP